MWSTYAEAIAFNLPKDLAIETRRYPNGATAVQQEADTRCTNLILGISAGDLSRIECTAITVAQ